MMRVCHLNTCPVGVATQDPRLREKFTGDPEHVVNFMRFIAQEVRELMAQLGFRTPRGDGRPQRLPGDEAGRSSTGRRAASTSRPSSISPTWAPRWAATARSRRTTAWRSRSTRRRCSTCAGPPSSAARRSRPRCPSATATAWSARSWAARSRAATARRACPTTRSSSRSRARPARASAPSSRTGMTLTLEGDANDYVGKGLSGGKIIVYPPRGSTLRARGERHHRQRGVLRRDRGEAYIRGMAGERFCVRNSGVNAVVEAVGDHGCEYMTGGRVVVLGPDRAATSRPACAAASPTCWTRTATSPPAATRRWCCSTGCATRRRSSS